MEQVSQLYSKSNLVSGLVTGRGLQAEWIEIFSNAGFSLGTVTDESCRKNIAGKLNLDISSPTFIELEKICSEDKLKCSDVDVEILNAKSTRRVVFTEETRGPQNKDLSTLSFQMKDLKKRHENTHYRNNKRTHFHYVHFPEQSALLPKSNRGVDLYSKLLFSEVVYLVHVFKPVHSTEYISGVNRPSFPKLIDQVIAVPGSQKLIFLKDAITCRSNHTILGEFSENPSELPSTKAQDVFRSGYFYIEGTFYNDLRTSVHQDLSSDLIKYSQDPKRRVGPFGSKRMENTLFIEMELRLGYPYLFVHQGSCEHVIVFADLRMLDPEESHISVDYPVTVRVANRRKVVCMICQTHTTKWITYGNKRLSDDPYYFCDMCFKSFNYTSNGKKIGSFRAYPFVDRTLI